MNKHTYTQHALADAPRQTCNVRLLLSQSHLYPGEVFVVWFVDSVGVYPLLLPQLLNLRAVEQFAQNAPNQWPQPQRY